MNLTQTFEEYLNHPVGKFIFGVLTIAMLVSIAYSGYEFGLWLK